jgi:biotin-(acetyl-CoA carboxylase) ligase
VRVELADERFEGLATDLTPEGHLVVEVSGATRTVVTGDVVHVRTTG